MVELALNFYLNFHCVQNKVIVNEIWESKKKEATKLATVIHNFD